MTVLFMLFPEGVSELDLSTLGGATRPGAVACLRVLDVKKLLLGGRGSAIPGA